MDLFLFLIIAFALLPLLFRILQGTKSAIKENRVRRSYDQCIPLIDAYLQGADFLREELAKLDKEIIADALSHRACRGTGGEPQKLKELFTLLGCLDLSLLSLKGACKEEILRALARLGDIGISEPVKDIASLLSDPDPDIVHAAVSALGRIGTEDAIAGIIDFLDRSEGWTASDFAPVFLDIKKEAHSLILGYLNKTVAKSQSRIVELLAEIRANWALSDIHRLAFEGEFDVKLAAVKALGRIGDRSSCTVLEELITDSSWEIRAAAARSLGKLKSKSSCYLLAHSLTDEMWQVRLSASEALLKMGRTGERTLVKMLFSENKSARRRAAEALEISGVLDKYFNWLIDGDDDQMKEASLIVEALIDAGVTGRLDDYFGEDEQNNLKKLIDINLRKRSAKNNNLRQVRVLELDRAVETQDDPDCDKQGKRTVC